MTWIVAAMAAGQAQEPTDAGWLDRAGLHASRRPRDPLADSGPARGMA